MKEEKIKVIVQKEAVAEISESERLRFQLLKRYSEGCIKNTYHEIIKLLRNGNFDNSRNDMQMMLDYAKATVDNARWCISDKDFSDRVKQDAEKKQEQEEQLQLQKPR